MKIYGNLSFVDDGRIENFLLFDRAKRISFDNSLWI